MFQEKDRLKCDELYGKYDRGRKLHDVLYRDVIRHYRQGVAVGVSE